MLIEGRGIDKSYGNVRVLNSVDIEVKEGDFVCIMGPSGSGKSTLLFSVSGIDKIDGGTVKFREREISSLCEEKIAKLRRNEMGFVFQQPSLLKNLNILDNIALAGLKKDSKSRDKIYEKAMSLMKKTGIEALCDREITEVSGGELQRAGICRALINEPVILFGDEPTGLLNSKTSEEIIKLFRDINNEGTAVFLVTHDPKVASNSKRVLFMKDGKIIDELMNREDFDINYERLIEKMKELNI